MLTAGDLLVNDLGDAIARDPEVRQARMIAEAARTRLVMCVSRTEDGIDLAEAQGMLDALRNAWELAGDAEDRVLLHLGLLSPAEADRRAAMRDPAARRPGPAPDGRRRHRIGRVPWTIAGALALALVGVILARWSVRPRPARR